jgi:hypothetical protein
MLDLGERLERFERLELTLRRADGDEFVGRDELLNGAVAPTITVFVH